MESRLLKAAPGGRGAPVRGGAAGDGAQLQRPRSTGACSPPGIAGAMTNEELLGQVFFLGWQGVGLSRTSCAGWAAATSAA